MDILERLKGQAEQAEVIDLRSESTTVAFESNRLKGSRVEEVKGTAVRVVKDGRIGFAASTDEAAVEKLMGNVLESARYGDEVPISFPGPSSAPEVNTYDSEIAKMSIGSLVEVGQEVLDLLLEVEPEAIINYEVERSVQDVLIRNHTGTEVSFQRSPLSTLFKVTRIKGDDVLRIYDVTGTTAWQDDHLAAAHRLCDLLKVARRSATIKSGRMPVLFSPRGALVLGLPLMMGLNGKNVYTGISPMAGRIGEKLFDSKLTIVDDPLISGRFGSASHDDEGVAHRRNVLVGQGVLNGFMYDLKTAAQSGVEPTGNGSRSLFAPPSPSPTNLVFAAGETPLADLIAGIDEGLLVENVLGLGQGNVISGAFSNTLSLAFKIEGGEIVGRVKDVSIAGNVYELLTDVAGVSRETGWVYYNFNLPHVLLPDVNVVAKE